MDDNELIQWYKRVFDEYPSVGLLAFIREVMEQAAPVSAWEVCEGYESMSKNAPLYLSPSQCRMLAEEGWRLVRPTTATSESQESVFSRAASSIALAALREAHERGETISIPSLGIEIPPLQRPATAAGEEE